MKVQTLVTPYVIRVSSKPFGRFQVNSDMISVYKMKTVSEVQPPGVAKGIVFGPHIVLRFDSTAPRRMVRFTK